MGSDIHKIDRQSVMTILQVHATMHAEERREIWYFVQLNFVPFEYQEIRGLRLRGIQRCEDTDHDARAPF